MSAKARGSRLWPGAVRQAKHRRSPGQALGRLRLCRRLRPLPALVREAAAMARARAGGVGRVGLGSCTGGSKLDKPSAAFQ
jgi:hypothetical protein